MMDLAHQRIVNQEIPARQRALHSFRPHSGREPGGLGHAPRCGADKPQRELASAGASLTPFWVLWVVSNLLSLGLGMVLIVLWWGEA